jgi:hypothetical protein
LKYLPAWHQAQSRAVDEPWCHGEASRRRIVPSARVAAVAARRSGAEEGNCSSSYLFLSLVVGSMPQTILLLLNQFDPQSRFDLHTTKARI